VRSRDTTLPGSHVSHVFLHKAGFIENIKRLGRYSRETILISRCDVVTQGVQQYNTGTHAQLNCYTCGGSTFGPRKYNITSTNSHRAREGSKVHNTAVGRSLSFISHLETNVQVPRVCACVSACVCVRACLCVIVMRVCVCVFKRCSGRRLRAGLYISVVIL